ncbi:MAG: SDR family oxidoreductase [Vampirovibrionales bacterium]|jgi:3-oxoacyl-[acyl-carrier protein] reductase|nr:SDR family oxidoreductase [Vampirovibrionales bacterium]
MQAYKSSQQRNALICASSQGLGLAVANRLAEDGHNLFLVARNEERLAKVKQELEEAHKVQVHTYVCDLNVASQRTKLLEALLALWPAGPDILVHNTGGPTPSTVLDTEYVQWTHGFNSLFLSVVQINQALVPLMVERGWGRVVTVTSLAAKEPLTHLAVSNALRSGISAYSKTLATEVASSGVTVNCVAPGYIQTERLKHLFHYRAEQAGTTPLQAQRQIEQNIPAQRIGKASEFAHAVSFLCSEGNSYMTGQTLVVDGGLQKSTF